MQEDPPAPGNHLATVDRVTHQGEALVAEVSADLVEAARVQPDLHEAVAVPLGAHKMTHRSHLCECSPPMLRHSAAHNAGWRRRPQERHLQRAWCQRCMAVAEGHILLPNAASSHLQTRQVEATVTAAPQESSRGLPVETVHESMGGTRVCSDGELLAELMNQPILVQRAGVLGSPALLLLLLVVGGGNNPSRWLPETSEPPLRQEGARFSSLRCRRRSRCTDVRWRRKLPHSCMLLEGSSSCLQQFLFEQTSILQGGHEAEDANDITW
mmetsp:Transcript_3935/g.9048  ORF Transcript_3935/g.9048 Transcript_3935/m.9048 type:complete len:269 (+) Transcript_3935:201-1007(+)